MRFSALICLLILPCGALAGSETNPPEFPKAVSSEALVPEAAVPESASPDVGQFFVLANLEFTLLHEFSHMLIEELKLPVLGTEEDAADRIAMIVMLRARQHQSAEEVIPWLFAVAGDWYTEWELKDRPSGKIDYWDNHHLEIQRFHNIVCLIYGGKVELLEDLIDTEILPFERAMSCEAEYRQADHAVQWLLDTYGHSGKIMNTGEQFTVTYEEPIEGQNELMFDLLQSSRVAEKLVAALSARFSLPRPISIEFDNCVSEPDAYWHSPTASVTVCYELLGHFLNMAEYRQKNSRRACNIPSLRRYMGARLRCNDSNERAESEGEAKIELSSP
ncbi:MAG: DUF4344 domain-containing metallopeptidase [Porticoccaceae bacterium]|nr:DUF4344 domain-containing metallopeptidase [Porticoccaceae bacterium]